MYQVLINRKAEKELSKINKTDIPRVFRAIKDLGINPRPTGSKKLVGEDNAWRIRVGNYRILYEVEDIVKIVTVYKVGHRKDVYD